MNIENIMTRRVVTVELDDNLLTVQNIFQHMKFHHLLVVENKKLVGILSDRDFLKEISPFIGTMMERRCDKNSLNKRVHQIMSRRLITITPDTPIERAAFIMMQNTVSCLPVVFPDGTVAGLVSWKDLLRFYVTPSASE